MRWRLDVGGYVKKICFVESASSMPPRHQSFAFSACACQTCREDFRDLLGVGPEVVECFDHGVELASVENVPSADAAAAAGDVAAVVGSSASGAQLYASVSTSSNPSVDKSVALQNR